MAIRYPNHPFLNFEVEIDEYNGRTSIDIIWEDGKRILTINPGGGVHVYEYNSFGSQSRTVSGEDIRKVARLLEQRNQTVTR